MATDVEIATIKLDIERLRLESGDLLVGKLPEAVEPTYDMIEVVTRIIARALEQAGISNTVLVVPFGMEFEAVAEAQSDGD